LLALLFSFFWRTADGTQTWASAGTAGGFATTISSWRRARTKGQRIPERLWKAAAQLGSEFGVNRTAKLFKVDYYHLKKRLDRRAASSKASPSFVELSPVPFSPASECVIEFEDALGATMRVHLKGTEIPDLLALGRGFWAE
jgi:hypothetical protein